MFTNRFDTLWVDPFPVHRGHRWIVMTHNEVDRLLVLRTAWRIDQFKDYRAVRKDIAAVKVAAAKILHDVV